jgi:hypothetical protein
MASIKLGGHEFSEDEVIAAIQASNDPEPAPAVEEEEEVVTAPLEATSIEDVKSILQALLLRVQSLENRSPVSRAGYGVTTTTSATHTKHIVQCLDELGRVNLVTFEIPLS